MIHEFCESINDKCLTESIESPFDKVLIQFPSTDKFEYTWNTYYKRRKEIIDKKGIKYLLEFQKLFYYNDKINFTLESVANKLCVDYAEIIKREFNKVYYPYTYCFLKNHRKNYIKTTKELLKYKEFKFKVLHVLPTDLIKILKLPKQSYKTLNDNRVSYIWCNNCGQYINPVLINKIDRIKIKCTKCKKIVKNG